MSTSSESLITRLGKLGLHCDEIPTDRLSSATAALALRAGLFSHPEPAPPVVANLFSTVVLMAILAAVISPDCFPGRCVAGV